MLACILGVAVAWTVFVPSWAEAQQCVVCTNMGIENEEGDWELGHVAQDHPNGIHGRGGGTHPDVLWDGWCSSKHPLDECGRNGGGALYRQASGALEAVLAAVSVGDALEAYRVVLRQPKESLVQFVPERTAIQVRGCGDHVIAHIPLAHLATAEFLAAVAAGRGALLAP